MRKNAPFPVAEVAEMNYKMRNSFGAVPSCRYVSFEEILRSRTKAGAKQGGSINEKIHPQMDGL